MKLLFQNLKYVLINIFFTKILLMTLKFLMLTIFVVCCWCGSIDDMIHDKLNVAR